MGAGNGMLTRGLLGIGRVIGLDPSAALLARLVSSTPSVPVARAVAEAMPFPDASFDGLVASRSLHWFEGPAFDEVIRVLRPGGAFGATWNLRDARDPLMLALEDVIGRKGTPRSCSKPSPNAALTSTPLSKGGPGPVPSTIPASTRLDSPR